jgi:hypothetical protein
VTIRKGLLNTLRRQHSTPQVTEHDRFEHLMAVTAQLPTHSLEKFIRAIMRPVQSDLIIQCSEGRGEPPRADPDWLFFDGINHDPLRQYRDRLDPEQWSLNLACDVVLPWPWMQSRLVSTVGHIGGPHGRRWTQDRNHRVALWLPWHIGFVHGGNHSLTAGILSGEGTVTPTAVYDCQRLLGAVHTDGHSWYVHNQPVATVRSGRSAAVFEIGRRISSR